MRQLLRFGYQEAASCVFAGVVFGLLAVTSVLPLPIARYDALLVGCLVLTGLLWLLRVETGREVLVIGLFHLVGLALELFKVRAGSWSYPEDAFSKIGGVPLYSGFMYAAVGSYLCQAWRRLDLGLIGYRAWPTAAAAMFIYANFFTHHWLPDLRLLGALGLLAATWRTTVTFRVGTVRYSMPLALSFVLIGGSLWLAENAATFLGAWQYPDQGDVWRVVHLSKLGSWALLVSVSFVLVAALKRRQPAATAPEHHIQGQMLDLPASGVVQPACSRGPTSPRAPSPLRSTPLAASEPVPPWPGRTAIPGLLTPHRARPDSHGNDHPSHDRGARPPAGAGSAVGPENGLRGGERRLCLPAPAGAFVEEREATPQHVLAGWKHAKISRHSSTFTIVDS